MKPTPGFLNTFVLLYPQIIEKEVYKTVTILNNFDCLLRALIQNFPVWGMRYLSLTVYWNPGSFEWIFTVAFIDWEIFVVPRCMWFLASTNDFCPQWIYEIKLKYKWNKIEIIFVFCRLSLSAELPSRSWRAILKFLIHKVKF